MPLVMLRLLEATVADVAFPEDHDYELSTVQKREHSVHGWAGMD